MQLLPMNLKSYQTGSPFVVLLILFSNKHVVMRNTVTCEQYFNKTACGSFVYSIISLLLFLTVLIVIQPQHHHGTVVYVSFLNKASNDVVCVDRFFLCLITIFHIMYFATRYSTGHIFETTSLSHAVFESCWISVFWPRQVYIPMMHSAMTNLRTYSAYVNLPSFQCHPLATTKRD